MKKLVFVLIFTIILPCKINAYSYISYNAEKDAQNKLVYNVEEVVSDGDNITFKGWAYVNRIHTIGGKNYKISISAISKSDFESGVFFSDITKTENNYTGKNELYPLTCYRDSNGCKEVYFGYKPGIGTNNITKNATCDPNNAETSCIHYDPRFSITFSYEELKKLGDEIVFLININYKLVNTNGKIEVQTSDSLTKCIYNSTNNKYSTGCKKLLTEYIGNKISRTLAFDKSVLEVSGKEFNSIINSKFSTFFKNVSDKGKIHTYNNSTGVMEGKSGNYFDFDDNNEYNGMHNSSQSKFSISTSKIYSKKFDTEGIDTNIRWYGLKISKGSGNYYIPNNNGTTYYGPATLGIVDGIVNVKLNMEEPPPNDACWEQQSELDNATKCNCEDVQYTAVCHKQVSIDILKTYDINGAECKNGKKGTIKAVKVYEIQENTKIEKGDLFKMGADRKVWPGIKWNQPVEWLVKRTVEWRNYDADENKIYYQAERYYDSDPGTGVNCVKEGPAWVGTSYLLSKRSAEINNYINTAKEKLDTSIDDFAINRWENTGKFSDGKKRKISENNRMLKLGFRNSSDNNMDRYIDRSEIINVTMNTDNFVNNTVKNTFYAEEKFEIKNAWLYDTKVQYNNSKPNNSYVDGGKYYYFAFNLPVPYDLKFTFGLDFKSLVRDMSLKDYDDDAEALVVWCKLRTENGNLETMNYRVIDLSNPFPNVKPTLDPTNSRAVNWYDLYNTEFNGEDYLYKRTKNNPETYTVKLTPANIAKIREDNAKAIKANKTYINAELNSDGTSVYIRDNLSIFKFEEPRIVMYDVGKGEAN